jgi:tetratricopeptide (TPR) repeat protein
MASNWDTKTLFDLIQRHWHKPLGLLVTIVTGLLFVTFLLNNINASSKTTILAYLIVTASSLIIWWYSNKIPKTKKGKVGFVVCIQYSNDDEEKVISEDFVTTLRKLLKSGPNGHTFHFIETPKHISQSIKDNDDAAMLRARMKAHFLIFGRVRIRKIDGKDCHIIELDGIVSHKPLAKGVSNQLAKEFGDLFPRRLQIPIENDLLSLNFTSDWTECVAKYIIGIAAACSSDIYYAESLYKEIEKKLEIKKTDFPIFDKLKERLPIRFSEISIAKSKAFLNAWRKNQDDDALLQFISHHNNISDELANSYDVLLLQSVRAFLDGRRIKDAIDYINKCKRFNDPIWHFNLAFLEAYKGDLKKSIRQYRKGASYNILPTTLSEVEDFMVWILEEEPDKYQYYYCLGFFNWEIKGDLVQALHDFNKFLEHTKNGEFIKEKALATKWISEIQRKTPQ